MSDDTPNLALPYLAPSQAQKHVTHNEALRMLDAVVQLSVTDRTLTTPPATPAEGERHIVAAGAGGAWAGKDGQVAMWRDGAWGFAAPRPGWLAWVVAETALLVRGASAWAPYGQTLPQLGVNATADSTNRLAVGADASLFTHAGHGHQVKVVKAAAGETASIVFQSAYSSRAEIGLTGDNDLHFKVSSDGSTWRDAFVVVDTTAVVAFFAPPRVPSSTVAGLPPSASAGPGAIILVTDAAGGAVMAFNDGSAWRRMTDRSVVS